MNGQYSIWDYLTDQKNPKPCEYSFLRYIGQKVSIGGTIGIIEEIEDYYTIVDAGDRYMIGTPTNMCPIKGGDLNDSR